MRKTLVRWTERALLWALATTFRVPSAFVNLLLRIHLALKPAPSDILRNELDAEMRERLHAGLALDAAWAAVAHRTSGSPALIAERCA